MGAHIPLINLNILSDNCIEEIITYLENKSIYLKSINQVSGIAPVAQLV